MAYKDEEDYKTTKEQREYLEQWRRDHPGYHAEASKIWNEEHSEHVKEYAKGYRESKKQNILYMTMIDDEYYFGHTSKGMVARRAEHIHNSKYDKPGGNHRLRKLFKMLGEDEFMKRITFKVIKTFDTKADAQAAEKLMLKIYVGQKECMNKRKH